MDMNLRKLWETVKDREAGCAAIYGITKSQTWLGNWTTVTTERLEFQIGDVYLLIDKESIEGYKTGMNNQGGEPHAIRC